MRHDTHTHSRGVEDNEVLAMVARAAPNSRGGVGRVNGAAEPNEDELRRDCMLPIAGPTRRLSCTSRKAPWDE
jgi:hypothetical protein